MKMISPRALVTGAAVLTVFAARSWLVRAGGDPVPYWDQWDGEALRLYRPWLTDTLAWSDLLAAHNEHRMALTRVADLALLAAAGEWNLWWQLLLNAALHAATAGVVVAMFWPALARAARITMTLGVVVLFAAPSDWHNALWGFQSAFYFANLLAAIAFAAIATGAPGHARAWWGCGAALLALFSNASGLLVGAAAFSGLALSLLLDRRIGRSWLALVSLAAVLLVGGLLHVVTPEHAPGRAQSVAQFVTVFTRCLAWPQVEHGIAWILLQAPLLVLTVQTWRRREPADAALRFAWMLAAFALLQAAAVAYSRGGILPLERPISRYFGPLLLGAAANGFAALRLATGAARSARLLLLGWSGATVAGLWSLTLLALTLQLPYQRALNRDSHAVARRYFVTPDRATFLRETPYPMLHPDPEVAARVIDDSILRPILPAAIRLGADHPAAAAPWPVRHAGAGVFAAVLGLALALAATRAGHTGRTRW